jgi:hypothetical protein
LNELFVCVNRIDVQTLLVLRGVHMHESTQSTERKSHKQTSSYTIPAQPTYFDGQWFQSRLEARWAAFFKALGIVYEYNGAGETFALQNYRMYTPDFYLADLDVYVEIKYSQDAARVRMREYQDFAKLMGKRLLVISGEPGERQYSVAVIFGNGKCLIRWGLFAETVRNGSLAIRRQKNFGVLINMTTEPASLEPVVFHSPRIKAAFRAASHILRVPT